jgi:hypothetical protein
MRATCRILNPKPEAMGEIVVRPRPVVSNRAHHDLQAISALFKCPADLIAPFRHVGAAKGRGEREIALLLPISIS